jgi:Helix-turn-helix domain
MSHPLSPELSEEYADRFEAARLIGHCAHTLTRWEADGKGPPITRLGRRVLYNRASLKAWIRSLEQPAKVYRQERAAQGSA